MNFNEILKWSVPGMSAECLERASAVFILYGTSFAVVAGTLYMSEESLRYLKLRYEFIMHGENGEG